jgi:hypothetical protein
MNMITRRLTVLLLGGVVSIAACATTLDIRSEPLTRGVSRSFSAGYDRVVKAAHESVVESGLKIVDESVDVENTSTIVATKPVSMFSYGEVVRMVIVRDSAEQTIVRVLTRRRVTTNVTARGDWSPPIFSRMESRLR